MAKRVYPKLHTTLAANVREARQLAGLSQQQLAEQAEISTNFVAQIEQGRRFPSALVLERIAKALGLRPYQLFYDADLPEQALTVEQATVIVDELKKRILADVGATIAAISGKIKPSP